MGFSCGCLNLDAHPFPWRQLILYGGVPDNSSLGSYNDQSNSQGTITTNNPPSNRVHIQDFLAVVLSSSFFKMYSIFSYKTKVLIVQ